MLVYEEMANDLHYELGRIEKSRQFVYVRAPITHCALITRKILRSHYAQCKTEVFILSIIFSENFSSILPVESLLDKWCSRLPDPRLHPISVWDDFVTNR